ncbi:MAG: hypothetical protein U9N86_02865, partial [Bacteroidota bacterium]|nr:hypothetical protein [Bacteroidota bacterium]
MSKTQKIIIALFSSCIFLQSCENDLSVNLEPFQSIPVLYGMIDPFAETNQIRISRVFFGANGINNSLLSNDSISFSSIDVILELTDL